jgi:Glucodextranase, domain B/FecR protein
VKFTVCICKSFFELAPRWAMALVVFLLFSPGPVIAERDPLDAPLQVEQYGENDTIRDFVARHLRDPDLWPVILALNNIDSPADLTANMLLRLPVRQVMAADDALSASLHAIQNATAEGARIFAPKEIGQAIENRDVAILRRTSGDWRKVVSFSGLAADLAKQALDISIAQRDRSAQAVVSDVQGDVEGRAPAEPVWSDRELHDILIEFERLRTLSASTTQVTFRDQSRLRLNSNSNATIQRMRSDPLTGGEVTKVSLAKGDFYAVLNQLSEKTSFEIDVPGIETTTNSADFWIKNDQSGARFVNYDDADLEIRQGDETIALGENEGVVIGGQGAERAMVLTSPRLLAPPLGDVIYSTVASLKWEEFDGAEAYWLEIANDSGFNQMQVSEWGVRGTGFEATGLEPSRYHWRVAALDQLGLPGEWSTQQDFTLRTDNTPPYLTLLSPAPDTIVTLPRIEVLGATELESSLTLNGADLLVAEDGSFLGHVDLRQGENVVSVHAVDPAGNTSTRSLKIVYRPPVSVVTTLSDQIPRVGMALATRSDKLAVHGHTTASIGATVVVRDENGVQLLQTVVGDGGQIQFVVPANIKPRKFILDVLAPGGAVEGQLEFDVVLDDIPPVITLDLPPPRFTSEELLQLKGATVEAVKLEINGVESRLSDGRFDVELPLVPGSNSFDLVASDATGNVSLKHIQILLDIDPPEIVQIDLGRPNGVTGPIELKIEAHDASGLQQAAPFVISIGGTEREGFLRCDATSGICRASLPAEAGVLELIELIVEDYAGNAAFE